MKFIDTYDKNKYVITSRPGTNIERLNRFENYSVCPLSNSEIENFIIQQTESMELQNRLISTVFDSKYSNYIHFLSNPLLLSMYIRNYEFHPEIPQLKNRFYFNLFDTLYQRHDGESKFGFIHSKETGFIREEFESILRLFSFASYFDGQFSFSINYLDLVFDKIKQRIKKNFDNDKLLNDLYIAISIFTKEGNDYKFPHRSLQEYFASSCISQLQVESKINVYQNKIPNLQKHSDDSLINFWEICQEMDKQFFLKYFLIPETKKHIAYFNGKDFLKSILNFLNIIVVGPVPENGQYSLFQTYKVQQKWYPLLMFFGVNHDFNRFLEQKNLFQFVQRFLTENKCNDLKYFFDIEETYFKYEEELKIKLEYEQIDKNIDEDEDNLYVDDYDDYDEENKDDEDEEKLYLGKYPMEFRKRYFKEIENNAYSIIFNEWISNEKLLTLLKKIEFQQFGEQIIYQLKMKLNSLEMELDCDNQLDKDILELI